MAVVLPSSFGKKYSEIITEMHLNGSLDASSRYNSYLTFSALIGREVSQHLLEIWILIPCRVLFPFA